MPEHSPLPWRLEAAYPDASGTVLLAADGEWVAPFDLTVGLETARANARLAVTAVNQWPALLQLLRAAERIVGVAFPDGVPDYRPGSMVALDADLIVELERVVRLAGGGARDSEVVAR